MNDYSKISRISYLSNDIIHVDNALIKEVVANTGSEGYVLISFHVANDNKKTYMEEVRLNVGSDTLIIDEKGRKLNLYDLEKGMHIDGEFSSAMTRSIPPQSYTYRIVLLQEKGIQ